jgi:hypothetical protein
LRSIVEDRACRLTPLPVVLTVVLPLWTAGVGPEDWVGVEAVLIPELDGDRPLPPEDAQPVAGSDRAPRKSAIRA